MYYNNKYMKEPYHFISMGSIPSCCYSNHFRAMVNYCMNWS